MNKMKLIKLANRYDELGYYERADAIDSILKKSFLPDSEEVMEPETSDILRPPNVSDSSPNAEDGSVYVVFNKTEGMPELAAFKSIELASNVAKSLGRGWGVEKLKLDDLNLLFSRPVPLS